MSKFIGRNNLNPVFRLTSIAYPENLDAILAKAGFEKKDVCSVQVRNLVSFSPSPQTSSSIKFWSEFSQEWLDSFVHLSGVKGESQESLASLLNSLSSVIFLLSQLRVIAELIYGSLNSSTELLSNVESNEPQSHRVH